MAQFFLTKDSQKLGIVLGILGPFASFTAMYFLKFSLLGYLEFLDLFIHTNKLITSIGSLCLITNAVLFTIYINTNRDYTAKGIFIVTLIFGIGILLMKIFN